MSPWLSHQLPVECHWTATVHRQSTPLQLADRPRGAQPATSPTRAGLVPAGPIARPRTRRTEAEREHGIVNRQARSVLSNVNPKAARQAECPFERPHLSIQLGVACAQLGHLAPLRQVSPRARGMGWDVRHTARSSNLCTVDGVREAVRDTCSDPPSRLPRRTERGMPPARLVLRAQARFKVAERLYVYFIYTTQCHERSRIAACQQSVGSTVWEPASRHRFTVRSFGRANERDGFRAHVGVSVVLCALIRRLPVNLETVRRRGSGRPRQA